MIPGHQCPRLVCVVPNLVQRNQLIRERIPCRAHLVHVLVLPEVDGVVQVRPLAHVVVMVVVVVPQAVQMRRHRLDRRERGIAQHIRLRVVTPVHTRRRTLSPSCSPSPASR